MRLPPSVPTGADSIDGGRPGAAGDRAGRARRRRLRRARELLAGSVLVLAAALWGRTNPTDLRLVHDLLDHPIALGVLAWALAAAGLAGHVEDPVRRVVVGVLAAGVGATGFGLVGLVVSSQVSADRTTRVLPDPTGRALRAVVTDDGDQRHPVTRVVVEQTGSLLGAHRYEVACVQGPPQSRTAVTWHGSGLQLTTPSGAARRVGVAEDGRPDRRLRLGLLCER